MSRKSLFGFLVIVALAVLIATALLDQQISVVQAGYPAQQEDSVIRGAMFYDRWFAALNVEPPAGNMPLWASQTTNTRSGPDTWRCVTCHGWDYQGRDGAYRYGTNFTGFPGVFHLREQSPEQIVAALKGGNNPEHDFSPYLDDPALQDLAVFLTTAVIDDNEFIDPQTLQVRDGDEAHGQELYVETCSSCHGDDGQTIAFRFEGRDAGLGTLAVLDPWRFLHKTRFGTPGTEMPVGYELGWTPQDGRDVLLYARSMPTGLETAPIPPTMQDGDAPGGDTPGRQPGGPASNVITGVLTALGAVAVGIGFAVLLGGVLVGIILLTVWIVRGSNKP